MRILGSLIVFLAALVATSTVIEAAAPLRPAGSRDSVTFHKLDYALAHLAEYDVVYVGSSRTRRGFDPKLLDAELARRGVHVRSFNLGIPGLRAFAQKQVVKRLLAADTSRLKLVVLAPDALEVKLTGEQARVDRQVMWHNLRRTIAAIRAVADADASLTDRAAWAANHVDSLLLHEGTGGRLSSRFTYRLDPSQRRLLGPQGDGYAPFEARAIPEADFERRIARVRAVEARPAPRPTGAQRRYVRSLVRLARAHGVRVVFVREPLLQTNRPRFLRWFADRDREAEAVDLGNPLTHPELFQPRLFHDPRHLNVRGSRLYTRLLARELLPYLR